MGFFNKPRPGWAAAPAAAAAAAPPTSGASPAAAPISSRCDVDCCCEGRGAGRAPATKILKLSASRSSGAPPRCGQCICKRC